MQDILWRRARRSPEQDALLLPGDGPRSVTYRALYERACEIGQAFREWGIRDGDRIGLFLNSGSAFVSLFFAVLEARACPVLLQADLPRRGLRDHLKAVPCSLLLTDAFHREAAGAADEEGTTVCTVSGSGVLEERDRPGLHEDHEADVPASQPGQLIAFTSGTTGMPKPVVLTIENLLASARDSAVRLGHHSSDVWYDPLPLYHMGGLAPVIRSTLYGSSVLLVKNHPDRWPEALETWNVTGVSLVPVMLRKAFERRAGSLPDSVRFLLLGGGSPSEDLIEEARDRNVPLHVTYGMTETASQIATARPSEVYEDPGTAGRPLFSLTVRVVDRAGKPCESGESGEITVSGPAVTEGYFDRPELNERSFSELGLHTGDIGTLDESYRLHINPDRFDRIVTGGENVDPERVRRVLEEHPRVRHAGVLGIDDAEWGERVAAVIEPEEEGDVFREVLDQFLSERLAPHERPRRVEWVDELPRTVSGTFDRDRATSLIRKQ